MNFKIFVFWELTLTCFEQEVGLADLWGLFQPEWLCDPIPWASFLMVMSIIYVVPVAFTQWMTCNNFYFLDGIFLYCSWKENSLLNLFVSSSMFLISFVTWYLLYLLICVIPHILNKLLLPYHTGIVFFWNGVTRHSRFSFQKAHLKVYLLEKGRAILISLKQIYQSLYSHWISIMHCWKQFCPACASS